MHMKAISKMNVALTALAVVGLAAAYPALTEAAYTPRMTTRLGFSNSASDCKFDTSNRPYSSLATGHDPVFGFELCNVTSFGATATTLCSNATFHKVRVIAINNDGSFVTPSGTTTSTSWTQSTSRSYTIPAHGNCPAGTTVVAYAGGI